MCASTLRVWQEDGGGQGSSTWLVAADRHTRTGGAGPDCTLRLAFWKAEVEFLFYRK